MEPTWPNEMLFGPLNPERGERARRLVHEVTGSWFPHHFIVDPFGFPVPIGEETVLGWLHRARAVSLQLERLEYRQHLGALTASDAASQAHDLCLAATREEFRPGCRLVLFNLIQPVGPDARFQRYRLGVYRLIIGLSLLLFGSAPEDPGEGGPTSQLPPSA
jgi:hypothetical protein